MDFLQYLASFGLLKLKKEYNAWLNHQESEVSWNRIQMLKLKGYISQEEMEFIIGYRH